MPDVELIATRDFSYATRRLKAGDRFTVPAPMARVLVGIRKAEAPRVAGRVAPPPPVVAERIAEAVAPAPEPVEASAETEAVKPKRTVRRRKSASLK